MPAKPLTAEQKSDARRLKQVYQARKRELGLTQDILADRCGWKAQSAVSQYLNGKIPLGLDAALIFARELQCSVSDISPSLSQKLRAESPDQNHTLQTSSYVTKDVLKPLSGSRSAPVVVHDLPVITMEAIMLGLQSRLAYWVSDGDYITAGFQAAKGSFVVVDSRIKRQPADIVLAVVDGAILLRRLTGSPGSLQLAPLSGPDPTISVTDAVQIVGVATGSIADMAGRGLLDE